MGGENKKAAEAASTPRGFVLMRRAPKPSPFVGATLNAIQEWRQVLD
jgi:hypothetical protein